MPTITCVEDFRQLYHRSVPKMFCDYVEAGSYTEATLQANVEDFNALKIRQRIGVDVTGVGTSGTMAGQDVALPVAFAPVGMLGIQSAGGEIKVAKAAEQFGVPFILSTMSMCSIEDVAAATETSFWFQLYVVKDRDFVRDLIQRAKGAGCSKLVVTMDLPVLGQRHRDVKNKLSIRPRLKDLLNFATKPRWSAEMIRTPYKSFGNVVGHAKGVDDLASLLSWAVEMVDPALDWGVVEWIKKEWGGPMILKGVLDPEDARIAADMEMEAIVVSNHGGRQLDGAPSTISMLPHIADLVGDRMELFLDSGVRTGMDIFRARALGASGVLLGRAMVYALGAQGQAGVSTLLTLLQKELATSMALSGKTNLADIDRTDLLYDQRSGGD
ncbi:MAG: alpha-hydroxy-acid oxidizing protein [Hyphomicrobiales bacterium]|nr:alpha-hydroxy-acid oxidizing protein [Hyphomicrobiales bacterium]